MIDEDNMALCGPTSSYCKPESRKETDSTTTKFRKRIMVIIQDTLC
jgi:hypothetical protein